MFPGAPQKVTFLWRTKQHAPQKLDILWRMGLMRHRNMTFCGALGFDAPQKLLDLRSGSYFCGAYCLVRHRNRSFCDALCSGAPQKPGDILKFSATLSACTGTSPRHTLPYLFFPHLPPPPTLLSTTHAHNTYWIGGQHLPHTAHECRAPS